MSSSSVVIAYRTNTEETRSPWIGDRFQISPEPKNSKIGLLGFKKSIFPTKTLFQFGLHMHGACHMEHPWSGCDKDSSGFCYKLSEIETNSRRYSENFRTTHSFLDIVRDADTREIDSENEAVIYHVMFYRQALPFSIDIDVSKRNDYASIYFPQTVDALKKRNLDLLVDIVPTIRKGGPSVDESWIEYKALHKTRNLPHFSSRSRSGFTRGNQN